MQYNSSEKVTFKMEKEIGRVISEYVCADKWLSVYLVYDV